MPEQEYTLSAAALTELLLGQEQALNPQPIPPGQENQGPVDPIPWLTAHTAAQLALLQVKVLQDLKTRLPAEVHDILDDEIQAKLTLDPVLLNWEYCPQPPPKIIVIPSPAPGPNPPPGPLEKLGSLDRATVAAAYLRAANLHPAIGKLGDLAMHQAARDLNTGKGR